MLTNRTKPGACSSQRARLQRRTTAVIRASEEGVQDLLARDRKEIKLAPELLKPTAADGQPSTSAGERAPPTGRGGPRSRRLRQQAVLTKDPDAPALEDGPRRCKDAIDAGLALFERRDFQGAIDLFSLALELPGNGAYRLPGSPREYSCPSDAEEQAVMYNMACAYAQLGQVPAALTCVEAALEAGFTDAATLTSDADLAPLQGPQLRELIDRYLGLGAKLRGLFDRTPKDLVSDDGKNKPWILW